MLCWRECSRTKQTLELQLEVRSESLKMPTDARQRAGEGHIMSMSCHVMLVKMIQPT